jgi:hypothetical protein
MIVPSDGIEWSTRAVNDDSVVTSRCDRSNHLLTLETRSQVLAIIPLSALGSKIDDTYSTPIAGRRGVARLIGMIEVVKVGIGLRTTLSGFGLHRFVGGDEVGQVGIRGAKAPGKGAWVGRWREAETTSRGESVEFDRCKLALQRPRALTRRLSKHRDEASWRQRQRLVLVLQQHDRLGGKLSDEIIPLGRQDISVRVKQRVVLVLAELVPRGDNTDHHIV